MSHDHGWRAACDMTLWILWLHFEIPSIARGVTAMVVGSGAWLGQRTGDMACTDSKPNFISNTSSEYFAHGCSVRKRQANSATKKRERNAARESRDAQSQPLPRAGIEFPLSESPPDDHSLKIFWQPNVKDEPRPWLARRVRHDDLDSVVSLRKFLRSHAA